jgi:hypothetical protein
MTYSIRSASALIVLWLGALAATPAQGQNKAIADPADPNATVAPTRYAPMPAAHAGAPATPPAQNWTTANQTVAGYDSMSLTMETAAPLAQPAAPSDAHSHPMHEMHKMHKALK